MASEYLPNLWEEVERKSLLDGLSAPARLIVRKHFLYFITFPPKQHPDLLDTLGMRAGMVCMN